MQMKALPTHPSSWCGRPPLKSEISFFNCVCHVTVAKKTLFSLFFGAFAYTIEITVEGPTQKFLYQSKEPHSCRLFAVRLEFLDNFHFFVQKKFLK